MAGAGRIDGDFHVTGRLSCGSFTPPASSITAAAIEDGTGIPSTANIARLRQRWAQESATTAESENRVLHIATAAGTIIDFKCTCVVANIGAATVTFDLKKNGTTVLTGVVTLSSSHTARQIVTGTLSGTPTVVNGDVLEVYIVATSGGGTLGKGAACEVIIDEAAQ